MSAAIEDEAEKEINPATGCTCDFIQILEEDGDWFELHHVIPDDGAGHVPEPDCGCNPDIHRVEYDWIVVDHRDQDRLDDEPDQDG